MQKNAIIAIIAVAIVVVAGGAVAVKVINDKDDGYSPAAYNDADVRLRIFGNANGDDVINEDDVKTIQKIIDDKNDKWKDEYYFADANHDGKIDSKDVDAVKDIIAKKPMKMWYESAFSIKDKYDGSNDRIDAYVNYPIGTKIGCEYSDVDILSVLGVYRYFSATSETAQADYGNTLYPGISDLPTMGAKDELNLEAIGNLNREGKLDTLIPRTGGTSTNYIWDNAKAAGLTDKVSIVMVMVQGEHCVNGALMLACMLGDQTLSEKYVKWFDSAMDTLGKLDKIDKKTCIVMKTFNPDNLSNVNAYNQYQPPALWFSKVINFTEQTAGKKGFTSLGSAEAIKAAMGTTDFVICQTKHTPKVTNQEEYNTWAAAKIESIFKNLPVYDAHKVYTIDFSLMPFFGGPAGCLLLASQIYGDEVISWDDACKMVNEYCSDFMPEGSNTAKGMSWGYTYTGWRA
ncbi:MAG: dockerin type I repeat-containing protein [archaeon]|nr:dockerin type I repeat-containing protein [archaeon]